MKIFGRAPKRIFAIVGLFPTHVFASIRCIFLFCRPIGVLWAYIKRQNPSNGYVRLRNGLVIHLSQDNSDIVTVFLIFCRHDYGSIDPDCMVVDIGANIGVFALYAAMSGAKSVMAYEPAEESFALLKKNIQCNGYEAIIFPHCMAIVGRPSKPVLFSRQSSVFNSIEKDEEFDSSDHILVQTLPFSEIVKNLTTSNIVKIDCEGGEYDIVLDSDDSVFGRIEEIRIEYHGGPRQNLIDRFEQLGFIRRQFMDEGEGGGYLWLTRE
jgi:FkbM family methyltransferase